MKYRWVIVVTIINKEKNMMHCKVSLKHIETKNVIRITILIINFILSTLINATAY